MNLRGRAVSTWWAVGIAIVAGCDGLQSPQGPPPTVPVEEATRIAVFLPAAGLAELDVWEAAARREEQQFRVLAEIHRMAPGDSPESQAEAIRKAIEEGATGLLVMADNPKVVAPALESAREAGVPVVLLDRDVPVSGEPMPRVIYTPPAESAKALVDAAYADAKEAGFPPEGPAIILVHAHADRQGVERARALRSDLESRGVRVLPSVTYEGREDDASKALNQVFPTVPHLAMVLAEDDLGLKGASTFRHSLNRSERRFVFAGYTHERPTMELVNFNVAAAIVDRNLNEPIRRSYETILTMLKGETVPDLVVAKTPLNRANGKEKEGNLPGFLTMPQHAAYMAGGELSSDDHTDDHSIKED